MIIKPIYQALFFLLLTPISVLLFHPKNADNAWLIAAYHFIVFMVVNAGLLWFDDAPWRYFFHSIGFAVAYLLVIAIVMPILINQMQLKGSGESAMAFLLLIYHPIALLLIIMMKWAYFKWF